MPDFAVVTVQCNLELKEILMAELAEIGFDAFLETDVGLVGSVPFDLYNQQTLELILERYKSRIQNWEVDENNKENWNQKWEENYDPVKIRDVILIRAPFHKSDASFKYELIITPRMSFGTGHHGTTQLMLESQLTMDFNHKDVLDAGCGTGILSVLAAKLGARKIVCYDIEEWAVENAKENFETNNVAAEIVLGSVEVLPEMTYDIILANINKNVLLTQMKYYSDHLGVNGNLLISGFYDDDVTELVSMATLNGLALVNSNSRNNWVALSFRKN